MGTRRDRLDKRLANATATRRQNSPLKTRERGRRRTAMLALLKSCEPPYTPALLSWLSRELDKPAGNITPEDVQALLG